MVSFVNVAHCCGHFSAYCGLINELINDEMSSVHFVKRSMNLL